LVIDTTKEKKLVKIAKISLRLYMLHFRKNRSIWGNFESEVNQVFPSQSLPQASCIKILNKNLDEKESLTQG